MTAIVTPMQGGQVDEGGLSTLVRAQLAGGIQGLIVNGSTGEAATLTDDEQEYVLRHVVDRVAGAVPVVAGVGSRSTHGALVQARRAQNAGADALLVVTPAYNKPTQGGLIQHFLSVAENSDLPIVLYNVPGRTGVDLLPETVAALAAHPRIVAIKEATGSVLRAAQIRRLVSDDFCLLSGDDFTVFPFVAQGGDGCVSVASNIIPRAIVDLVEGARGTDPAAFAAARAQSLALQPLFEALFVEANPIPVKTAGDWMGLFTSAELRLPMTPLTAAGADVLAAAMTDAGLSFKRAPGDSSRLGPGNPLPPAEASVRTVDLSD
ncbi:MAG: 4-hydroxy-tetrahydrodipicolinate synthase [Deltaproteobacteria bacterium]|nr:4-hydroxy-tetrahydrodipicolinate synthase [Deltaproteobacteria bacterium]